MIRVQDIKWGAYLNYEGPFFRGNQPYILPANPNFDEICLGVVTATEGGSANAINMYDRCILSVGWIQWCEAGQYSVSDMLGASISRQVTTSSLTRWLDSLGVQFRVNDKGRSRFFFPDARGEVDTTDEQKQLFLLRSSGEKGTWDEGSKEYAKGWAAAIASLFEDPAAQQGQLKYTIPRLLGFVLPQVKEALFADGRGWGAGVWTLVARAAYISFAANNPTIAKNQYIQWASSAPKVDEKSLCISLLKQLTFGPKITIYPHRYEAIRPVLEKSFGVDLPDFASELQQWHNELGISSSDPSEYRLDSTAAIQKALLQLGFDLGPAGADGVMGAKTKMAITVFQGQHQLDADGIVGPRTRSALVGALQALRVL